MSEPAGSQPSSPAEAAGCGAATDGELERQHLLFERVLRAPGSAAGAPGSPAEPGPDIGGSELALAMELARVGLWRHDLRTNLLSYSPQSWRVLGLPPRTEPLTLEEVRALIHPDDLAAVQAAAQRALATDGPTDMEARYRHRDGHWVFVMTRRVVQRNAAGEPVAFLGVGIDITESRQAEQALRSARERAALASAAVGLGTWEVDLASGQTHWDAPMWTLRGHAPRPEAMTAEARLACVHPEDRARMAAANERGLREHVPLETEFRVVWPDGQVRWLASRAVSLFDDTGRAVRRIGVNWDITDHRRAAAAQQDSELARRENQAKSRFLSRMSHELRTPLNAVLGFAQLLLAAEQGDDAAARQRRRHLTHIERAGQHLLALINDVLDLSSLEGGEVRVVAQPVNLAELVSQALPLIQPLMTGQALSLHSEVPALHVLADPVRLRQALLNVLSNAVKYNRFGGAVRVTAAAEGAQVALRVADTGAGLSSEQLRHLFEPFNRLGAEQRGIEGTGIGLAIVRTLMERMGGSVSVTSTLGQGSEFTLRLPAARPEVPDAGAPPASGVGPPSGADPSPCPAPAGASPRPVVLYIEDNEINAIVVRELALRHGGAELRVAGTGAEGLRQARQLQPALLLLDMQLPDMDGRELLRQLRADPATAGLRCIALSAQAMPDQVHQALQAGVEAYWTKPLDFALFTRTLDGLAKAPGHPPQGPPAPYTPG